MDYATTLVAALLLGIGFVLQQYAARQEPESRFLSLRIITDLLSESGTESRLGPGDLRRTAPATLAAS